MRVLHVTSSIQASTGGTATAVVGLARAQAAAGLNVTLLTTERQGVSSQYVDAQGVATRVVAPGTGKLVRHPDLAGAARELVARADVVHVHSLWEEVQHQAARAARAARVPYLITPHGMLTSWSLAQGRLKKQLYMAWRLRAMLRGAALIHYTSEIERADVTASLCSLPQSITEPLGVDLEEYRTLPPRGAFRARHPRLADHPIVLFLGRLHPGKGLEHLLPAMAALRHTDAFLVAVGPDSEGYRAQLEQRARTLGIDGRVLFTGLLQGADKVAALVDADVFCLPSDHENFGVAVIEALAAGTPALVSEHVPVGREIVERGAGAIVPRAAAPLAAELDRWLGDAVLRRTASERGKSLAWEGYDWLQIARRWPEHYRAAGAMESPARPSTDRGASITVSSPVPSAEPVKLAIVSNSVTPYRVHVHQRIVRELPDVRLYSLLTHALTNASWTLDVPPEINPVMFGHGESSDAQAKLGSAVREWRKGGRIIRWLKEHAVRVVVVQGYNDPGRLRVIRWCRRNGVPCFLSGDSNILGDRATGWRKWLKGRLVPRVIRQCTGVMAVGSRGEAYFAKYGASPDRIFLFPYEPDYRLLQDVPQHAIEDVRERFSLRRERRRLLFAGRMIREKRPDLVVDAFVRLASQRPDWDLVMLGDGVLRAALEASVPADVKPRVTWTGFVAQQERVSAIFRLCDVLVLPSEYEPWAVVVNEAAAAGLAIVCSNVVGAAAELVRDGVNGWTFPCGDLNALTARLLDVTDPANVDRMKGSSASILAEWQRDGDPVRNLMKAVNLAVAGPGTALHGGVGRLR